MAWLAGFAGKAENLLNQLDNGAATVLKNSSKEREENSTAEVRVENKLNTRGNNSSQQYLNEPRLDIVREKENLSNTPQAERSPTQTRKDKDKQQQDEQLMKFLNGAQDIVEGRVSDNDWKRGAVSESTGSFSPGSLTERSGSIIMETDTSEQWGDSSCNSGRASSASVEAVMNNHGQGEVSLGNGNINGLKCDNVASWKIDLATQNQLLRQEINSLNQETTRVLARAKKAEKDVQLLHTQLEAESRTSMKQSDSLKKMEIQMGYMEKSYQQEKEKLRTTVEDNEQEHLVLQGQLSSVLAVNQRHLSESQDVAGVQSQAILAMEERMRKSEEVAKETEATLEDERMSKRNLELSLTEKIKMLELDRQNNTAEFKNLQKNTEGLKLSISDLKTALANSKIECGQSQKELIDYRTKAQRILQEKENFITQLKDGLCNELEENVQEVELKQITKERNLFCEEASKFSSQLISVRKDLSLLEQELSDEQEANRLAQNQLTQQLQSECERREELESDLSRQNEELRYMRDDLTRAKTSHLTAITDKEMELKRLRDQISFREKTGAQRRDEDQRIQQLTENLMKKQSLLETVTSEKNSMMYKIEHLERQLSEPSTIRSRRYGLPFLEENTIYSEERRPSFLQESPFDGTAARQAKRVYTEIDKLSIRVGIALRRYPIARIFVLFYMVILHFWVFLVLFTYTPDTGMRMMTGSPESPYPQALPALPAEG